MELYSDLLKDLGNDDSNYGAPIDTAHQVRAINLYCGDKFIVHLDGDEPVSSAIFSGHGCLVSKAAAALATELVVNRTWSEIYELCEHVLAYLNASAQKPVLDPRLEAFAPVRDYAGRYDCAALVWKELKAYAEVQQAE